MILPAFDVRPAGPHQCLWQPEGLGRPNPSPSSAPDFCRELALFYLSVTPVVIYEMDLLFILTSLANVLQQ